MATPRQTVRIPAPPASPITAQPLTSARVLRTWWPLAASWGMMALESPAVSATIARLPHPEITLAAYGGVIWPVVNMIAAAIIMMLGASTSLNRDWESFLRFRRFMIRLSLLLTLAHVLIIATPLYYVVVRGILGVPQEIVEPGRIGLLIMTPWTWSLAFRRFHQGILIRFGRTRAVTIGTLIRLATILAGLAAGSLIGDLPGVIVGPTAVTIGVVVEALYSYFAARPVIRNELRNSPVHPQTLDFRAILKFYIPLALTGLIMLMVDPIASAGLSRMPDPIQSLAVWPVAGGVLFLLRSPGLAWNEVVISLMDAPGSLKVLRRLMITITLSVTAAFLLILVTPLAHLWLAYVTALPTGLVPLAKTALWLAFILPGLTVVLHWFQGIIVHSQRTRGVTEAVTISLVTYAGLLVLGVAWGKLAGVYVGWLAFTIAATAQTAWMAWRSAPARRAIRERDAAAEAWLPSAGVPGPM
ncbi:MAG: hypothetical protein IT326_05365 [Anaerolineae bacterium]|nr:hypothetical protein [Anaerolineae bacterium]